MSRPGVRLHGTAGQKNRLFQSRYLWDCNWLQVKENSMDPAHVAFLHTLPGAEGFSTDFKELAEWDLMETPIGMVYIDTRLRRQGLDTRR
jgi:phenylpropionate dioxygenase-like ring-hydroxylating dioxygenase large terminal subunit